MRTIRIKNFFFYNSYQLKGQTHEVNQAKFRSVPYILCHSLRITPCLIYIHRALTCVKVKVQKNTLADFHKYILLTKGTGLSIFGKMEEVDPQCP